MTFNKIIVNNYYRFKKHPTGGIVKVLKKLKAKEDENIYRYAIIKCEHMYTKDSDIFLTRYFRPIELIEEEA